MLNENNIKYFAVDGEDKELATMLKQKSSSVCEINSEMLDNHFYAYNANGSSHLGTLSDEPQFIISPYQQTGERKEDWDQDKTMSKEEMIESQNWVVKATMSHVSHYWKDANGKRCASYSYVMLLFFSPNAKRIITNYHKGDRIMVEGMLETMNWDNPQDQASKVHVNYIRVSSFLCNGGSSIRRTALNKLLGKRDVDPNKRIKQIMDKINDPATSREQIVILANQLAEEKKKLQTVKRSDEFNSSMSESPQNGHQDERRRESRSQSNGNGDKRRAPRQSGSQSASNRRSTASRALEKDNESSSQNAASSATGTVSDRQCQNMTNRRRGDDNAAQKKNRHLSNQALLNRLKAMCMVKADTDAKAEDHKDHQEKADDLDPQYSSYFDQMVARMRDAYNANPEKCIEEERLAEERMEKTYGENENVIRDPEISDLNDFNFSGPDVKSNFASKEF